MPIGVKLDEQLSPVVGEPLTNAGYSVATVVGQGWGGMKDKRLFQNIQAEGRQFVTADLGFGDIRVFHLGTHAGIVLLRPDEDRISHCRALVQDLVNRFDLDELIGTLTVVSPGKIRVRRAP